MEDLRNKPESEMGVPLGGSFGRLISPFEAQELARRDKAKKKREATEQAAQEKRERREMRHKWIREEVEFERQHPNTLPTSNPPSFLSQVGCVFIALFLIYVISTFMASLG